MSEENTENKEEMFTKDQVQQMIDEEVKGLKSKNSELLGKNKDLSEKIDSFTNELNSFKTEAAKAKETALEKSGDLEQLKKVWEEKFNKQEQSYNDQMSSLKSKIKEGEKQEVINKLVGDFVDSEAASFMLKNMVEVEDGNQKFRDFAGNIVASSVDDYRKWIKTNPHMAHMVRGTSATGGNAEGSKAANNGSSMKAEDFYKMSDVERQAYYENNKKFNIED